MKCGHELHLGDLLLRPPAQVDADAITRACQDPAIVRWTTVPHPYRPEHAEDFVRSGGGESAVWSILGDDGGLAGVVSVRHAHRTSGPGGTAEVGYWVAPWSRGRGVATRAVVAVRDHMAAEHGVVRLGWEALAGNSASRQVALRAGFRMEGERRWGATHRGRLVDVWVGAWTLEPDEAPELVAGLWQLQPVPAGDCPDDLRPLAGTADSTWAVRHSTSGETHGHVVALSGGDGIRVVNRGADPAAAAAAARYLGATQSRPVTTGWPATDWP